MEDQCGEVAARFVQVVVQELLGAGVQRNVAGLIALTMHPQVRNAAPVAVVEKRGKQCAVAQALERFVARHIHQPAGFLVGDRRRLALVTVDLRAFDAVDGIDRHGVLVGQELI